MKLFLSSYRAGDHAHELVELVGKNSRIAVITNAKDYKSDAERAESVNDVMSFLGSLGLQPEEIDLREYFGKQEATKSIIGSYPAVWAAGGNSFILNQALRKSGADDVIKTKVNDGSLVYGGESAGSILATPGLEGVEFGDDPTIIPSGYDDIVINEGLGLVPYRLVPHFESDWVGASDMIDVLKSKNLDYLTLRDNEAIIINSQEKLT